MGNAILTQVIICDIARRGDGTKTPIRIIKQVFTTDGTLLATEDPLNYSIEKINEILENLPADGTIEDFKKCLTLLNTQSHT